MNVVDPIADLLTRIRNAQQAKHDLVVIPASKIKIAIVNILKQEGFIRAFKCVKDGKQGLIKVALKYHGNDKSGVVRSLKRESKPGRRLYVNSESIPYIKNGFGVAILSTSKGIVSCRDARKLQVGGEYVCSVY